MPQSAVRAVPPGLIANYASQDTGNMMQNDEDAVGTKSYEEVESTWSFFSRYSSQYILDANCAEEEEDYTYL